jgi:hypothetical protein
MFRSLDWWTLEIPRTRHDPDRAEVQIQPTNCKSIPLMAFNWSRIKTGSPQNSKPVKQKNQRFQLTIGSQHVCTTSLPHFGYATSETLTRGSGTSGVRSSIPMGTQPNPQILLMLFVS